MFHGGTLSKIASREANSPARCVCVFVFVCTAGTIINHNTLGTTPGALQSPRADPEAIQMQSREIQASIIREGIRDAKQLVFTCLFHPREFCPHILGTKYGAWHVFGWQFAGTSSRGLKDGGDWRCLELHDISTDILIRDGQWYRGWTSGDGPSSCVDIIDTVIDPAHAAESRNIFPAHTRGHAPARRGLKRG
jgi:hypothetical protein